MKKYLTRTALLLIIAISIASYGFLAYRHYQLVSPTAVTLPVLDEKLDKSSTSQINLPDMAIFKKMLETTRRLLPASSN